MKNEDLTQFFNRFFGKESIIALWEKATKTENVKERFASLEAIVKLANMEKGTPVLFVENVIDKLTDHIFNNYSNDFKGMAIHEYRADIERAIIEAAGMPAPEPLVVEYDLGEFDLTKRETMTLQIVQGMVSNAVLMTNVDRLTGFDGAAARKALVAGAIQLVDEIINQCEEADHGTY